MHKRLNFLTAPGTISRPYHVPELVIGSLNCFTANDVRFPPSVRVLLYK